MGVSFAHMKLIGLHARLGHNYIVYLLYFTILYLSTNFDNRHRFRGQGARNKRPSSLGSSSIFARIVFDSIKNSE